MQIILLQHIKNRVCMNVPVDMSMNINRQLLSMNLLTNRTNCNNVDSKTITDLIPILQNPEVEIILTCGIICIMIIRLLIIKTRSHNKH